LAIAHIDLVTTNIVCNCLWSLACNQSRCCYLCSLCAWRRSGKLTMGTALWIN